MSGDQAEQQPGLFRPNEHAGFVLFQTRHFDVRRKVIVEIERVLAGTAEIVHDDPRIRGDMQKAAAMGHSMWHAPVPIVFRFQVAGPR